jgi:hypothetical protein
MYYYVIIIIINFMSLIVLFCIFAFPYFLFPANFVIGFLPINLACK